MRALDPSWLFQHPESSKTGSIREGHGGTDCGSDKEGACGFSPAQDATKVARPDRRFIDLMISCSGPVVTGTLIALGVGCDLGGTFALDHVRDRSNHRTSVSRRLRR